MVSISKSLLLPIPVGMWEKASLVTSKWHSRNDVVDHQTDVRGEDGINHQLNDPLFHLER